MVAFRYDGRVEPRRVAAHQVDLFGRGGGHRCSGTGSGRGSRGRRPPAAIAARPRQRLPRMSVAGRPVTVSGARPVLRKVWHALDRPDDELVLA